MRFLLLVLVLVACTTGEREPIEEWYGKIYAGDSKAGSVTRSQSNESISCKSSDFDAMVCMTYDDLKNMRESLIVQNVNECATPPPKEQPPSQIEPKVGTSSEPTATPSELEP